MRRIVDPYVYLLASHRNGTLYLGVTSNLTQRIAQHCAETFGGFTAQYAVKLLAWYEQHATMENAILREKQIKKWRRTWKLDLIEQVKPDCQNLTVSLGFSPPG
ncbi:MAG: GIY-YIG nuclease family protein [Alphaproteobacteria bacterium]|nr:GIY-YIG nuclease family protein [Alphaproteobacteria bacterium]MBU0792745.1 GIY-YIG nuclease family protein [Alphaproteobacteria bacterium]MBU0875669.1 GIY-YIG nuclease family protein [Alphaproteobacteria bacterium]MBU1771456.1 GIY-YIG nuclease family protein [Alphaproteobacteria bacterium]